MSLLPESDADWGRQIRLALSGEASRPLDEVTREPLPRSRDFSEFEAALSEWSFAYGVAWGIARLRDPFAPPDLVADAARRLALEAWPTGPEEVRVAFREVEAEARARSQQPAAAGASEDKPRLEEFARNLGDIRAERPGEPRS